MLTVAVIPWRVFLESREISDLLPPVNLIIFTVIGFGFLKWKLHPIIYIAAAAVAGMVLL